MENGDGKRGDMPVIDPKKTWEKVEARLATETDPVLRRNLETILGHMKAEASGQFSTPAGPT
jgi:hypothetical protein